MFWREAVAMFKRCDNLLSVCLSILLTFVAYSRTQTMENYMLPKTIVPISYDLTVTPYFEFSTFAGTVIIDLKPNQHLRTNSIILHADRLEIKSIRLFSSMFGSTVIEGIECVHYDPEAQWLNITAVVPLSSYKLYTLYISYTGVICDDLRGFYRSSFVDSLGNTRWFAVTQLRPVFARRFLPSFDEPHYKSNFTVRVWHCPQYRVVSNMPIEYVETDHFSTEGKLLTTFQRTPKMPVFLLALAVFEFTPVVTPDGVHTSWTVPSKAKEAEYSVQMAPRLVTAMEQLAGSPFPLPKMDQIALPQLEPVAMENWGMNTYREINMLYNNATSPTRQIQNVPRFTAHEVAHYWIGNLATIDWWNWLWMSEAYAMFLEYYIPHQVEPTWRMTDQLVVDLLQPGLLGDSLSTSSPLTTQVITRQQIISKFTGLTYTKGPALIRMLRYFLTPERFQAGFRDLINYKAYTTFIPIEMWQFYNDNAEDMGLPTTVNDIMSTWTDTSGYPVVTVTRDYHTDSVQMKQEQFLVDSDNPQRTDPTKAWWIPLTYTTSGIRDFENTRTREWLSPNSSVSFYVGQGIFHLDTQEWFLMNIQQAGFYRVNYDEFNWNLLTRQLKTDINGIHVINRAQLVDDSLNLARAERLSYEMAFDLISYLSSETDYLPWQAALPSFSFLQTSLSGTPLYDRFLLLLRNLTTPRYSSIGFDEQPTDDHMTKLSRVQMVTWACYSGVEDCRSRSTETLNDFLNGKPSKMVPGLENVIMCTAVEAGDTSVWQNVQSYVLTTRNSMPSLTYAMACSKNDTVIARYLGQTAETGTSSLWSQTFTNVISRPYNVDIALNILINNYDFLNRRHGSETVRKQFSEIGPSLTTRIQHEKITKLISVNKITENDKTLLDIQSALQRKLNWLTRNYGTLNTWLTRFTIQDICENNLCVTD